MAQSLDDVLSAFTPEQRARVEARAQALIEEERFCRNFYLRRFEVSSSSLSNRAL